MAILLRKKPEIAKNGHFIKKKGLKSQKINIFDYKIVKNRLLLRKKA